LAGWDGGPTSGLSQQPGEAGGGEILTSAVTVRQSGTDLAEPIGLKHLKGRQASVEVYRIRWADTPTAQQPGASAYAE
jgi:hypothetical protein